MKNRTVQYVIIAICVMCMLGGLLLAVSSDTVLWGFEKLRADLHYAFYPPEAVAFVPQGQRTGQAPTQAAMGQSPAPQSTAVPGSAVPGAPTPTTTPMPTPTIVLATSTPTLAPTDTPRPTLPPTPLPAQARLQGITHMYQMMNNCGPANLAMALTYWGWKGDQRDTAKVLKPNKQDKNIMPYEMEAYVEDNTDLQAVVRVAGDVTLLKAFLASGFPVIIERGYEGQNFDGWMGHYQVINGYDDAQGVFIAQDSYKGPNQSILYDDLLSVWRAFNYTYVVIYPLDRRQQVLDILGLHTYDNFNFRAAEQRSVEEAARLSGRDLFFALFNEGSSRVALQDYAGAAQAYDAAFANYAQLPEDQRPWRMMWYQTGPYYAYFYTERYLDVVDLASQTLDAMSDPILEESFYWRGRGLLALGDPDGARTNLEQCLEVHEDFEPCKTEMEKSGLQGGQ